MITLLITALITMLWLFLIAIYIRPSYQRIRAREGK
jgi:hypothetical protein